MAVQWAWTIVTDAPASAVIFSVVATMGGGSLQEKVMTNPMGKNMKKSGAWHFHRDMGLGGAELMVLSHLLLPWG